MDVLVTALAILCIIMSKQSWLKLPTVAMLLVGWVSPVVLIHTLPYGGSGFPIGWFPILGDLQNSRSICIYMAGLSAIFMLISKSRAWNLSTFENYSKVQTRRVTGSEESANNILLLTSNYLILALFAVGQGPSLLLRESYLYADGSAAFRTFTTMLGPLWFMITLVMSNFKKLGFIHPACLFLLWEMILVAKGSRFALGIIICFALYSSQKFSGKFHKLLIIGSSVPIILITFQILSIVRKGIHGILALPGIITSLDPRSILSFSSIRETTFQIINSTLSSVPSMEVTLKADINQSDVFWQFNPLPRAIIGENLNEINLTPWLPASGLGVIVNSMGLITGLGFVLMFLIIIELLRRDLGEHFKDGKNLQIAATAVYFFTILILWQYSIRWSARLFTVMLLAKLLLTIHRHLKFTGFRFTTDYK